MREECFTPSAPRQHLAKGAGGCWGGGGGGGCPAPAPSPAARRRSRGGAWAAPPSSFKPQGQACFYFAARGISSNKDEWSGFEARALSIDHPRSLPEQVIRALDARASLHPSSDQHSIVESSSAACITLPSRLTNNAIQIVQVPEFRTGIDHKTCPPSLLSLLLLWPLHFSLALPPRRSRSRSHTTSRCIYDESKRLWKGVW